MGETIVLAPRRVMPMLKTKGFQADISPLDGTRISIMRSHLIPGTLQPDPWITPNVYDEWQPELAPPVSLLKAYRTHEVTEDVFARQYQRYMEHPINARRLHNLALFALENTATLLSTDREPEKAYRSLLAMIVHVHYPNVEIQREET